MNRTTRELMEQTMKTENSQQDDITYFINKALTCCENNDIDGVKQALRQLKLMNDALIIYRLTRSEIDWNDKSLCRETP